MLERLRLWCVFWIFWTAAVVFVWCLWTFSVFLWRTLDRWIA